MFVCGLKLVFFTYTIFVCLKMKRITFNRDCILALISESVIACIIASSLDWQLPFQKYLNKEILIVCKILFVLFQFRHSKIWINLNMVIGAAAYDDNKTVYKYFFFVRTYVRWFCLQKKDFLYLLYFLYSVPCFFCHFNFNGNCNQKC